MRCLAAIVLLCAACGFDPYDKCTSASAGDSLQCPTSGYLNRAFDLEVPDSWDGASPLPLIYSFHGGGGHRSSSNSVTCPGGDQSDPACLNAKATAMGYAIVRPDGSSNRPIRNVRSWNAGGGVDGWSCVGGGACRAQIDDMAYIDTVHSIVESILPIDPDRVFATGLSNGGAISNRLACERPQLIAAIASVGGTNQFAAAGGTCPGDVSFLHIHGTDDPIWIYETDVGGLGLQNDGIVVGAEDTTASWAQRNGCDAADPISTPIADTEDDGTSSTRIAYQGCARPVDLIRVEGGGHTWPGGHLYLSEGTIGKVALDFDADDVILEFFSANPR